MTQAGTAKRRYGSVLWCKCDKFQAPAILGSKQRHQFSGIRGFVDKSLVDLYEVYVLHLSTDGLKLVVRLVNNLGLYFCQGFGVLICLSDSLLDFCQSKLSILHFFNHFTHLASPQFCLSSLF